MQKKTTSDFKKADVNTALGWLEASENGLSQDSVSIRLKEFGFNEVPGKKSNVWLEFLSNFWGPIPWLLEVAALLTYLTGDLFDALVIASLLIINTSVSFYNEHDSKKALALLKRKLTIKTRVLRNNSWLTLEARELVPGDVIIVGLGDVVPADAKIFHGGVSADQSALTGESLPVELRESEVLFTGSVIKRGEAKCVVVNTGMNTYFGKTVELVNIAKPKSRQEEIMFNISRNMIYLGALAFAVILVYALLMRIPPITILTFAVLFIGGGIPAALPVMFTISQSKGATDLSKHGILVTKLDSIENAASVEILCLDKTGTITMNELRVSDAIPFSGFTKQDLLSFSALASSFESKDSIDQTVIEYAKSSGAKFAGFKQISYTPFEPATKRAEASVSFKGKRFKVLKGAPQTILSLCKGLSKSQKQDFSEKVNSLSLKGCRVLAVAKSDFGKLSNLKLVGLLALSDPLRPDSAQTIFELRQAGIKPIMLTGDNIAVAREMAKQSGIGDRIVRISDIKSLPRDRQVSAVENCDGIAEIYPEDKFWVVKLLQSDGRMVGMTGDGVNDAPALKQAELGIAVSSSSDVAKAAASMVLTEPGTRVILEAVRTSRETYQRMLTWTLKKITRSIQFMIVLTLGFFWLHDVVVSIPGLMLLVVVNDFFTMSLAVDNARSTKNPNGWNTWNITLASVFLGVLLAVIALWLLYVGVSSYGFALDQIKTLVLIALVYTGQFGIIIVRERGFFWASRPAFFVSATIAFALVAFTLMAIFGVVLDQIPVHLVLFSLVACIAFVLLLDPLKVLIFKRLGIS